MAPFIQQPLGQWPAHSPRSVLPAFSLHRKGGQGPSKKGWRSRELGGAEGAGGMSDKQAFTLAPAHRVLEKPLLCQAVPIRVCMEMSSPYY